MEDVVGDLAGGRYELHEMVGSGGTGSVRRAHDTLLDRSVAVKMLRGNTADETVRARMRAEAQLAGSLHHPGIAQVYDYGEETADGAPAPYIVMQYVEGTSLWQVLRERRTLPPVEVMHLVAQVASALEVAHEAGIVHRDLKPANMLVTPEGRIVLVDFGIARTQDADPLTLTGTIVGTADYISPEQSEGRSATSRSDLYSLGMVAYECLSGRKPFRRDSDVATALAHMVDEAPPLGPNVPEDVRALVEQMIAKDPEDRPVDAAEVAARAAALAGPLTSAPQPSGSVEVPGAPVPSAGLRRPSMRHHPVLRSRRVYVSASALLAAVACSVFVAARSPAVRVPDLEGQRAAPAEQTLEDHGFDVRRSYADQPGTRRGTVLDQRPAPGTRGEDDTVVTLTVASGRADLRAEDVTGESYDQAARDLVALGLVPSRAYRTQAEGAGGVVAVHPTGRLPQGTAVTLIVAVAPE
ncbi:serine/threonine-protein kinase [Nocardioides koreensis]|uniref:non-specific serine/threonine protein kinase n=1 Tax=Nocardioides koreensis TaxID=433651 RepID=A0ABN3A495_9ACTN